MSVSQFVPTQAGTRRIDVVALAAVVLVAIVAAALFSGVVPGLSSTLSLLLGAAIVLTPFVVYMIVKAPAFAFAAYAVFVPLENLVHVGGIGTLAKALGGGSGVLLILVLLLRRRAVAPGRAVYMWATLLAWMAVTLFWAIDPTFRGVVNVIQVLQLFVLYVIVGMVPHSTRELNVMLLGTTLGGVVAGLYGINQYAHGVHPTSGWQRLILKNGEEGVDFNHYAASLQMPIALSWGAVMAARSTIKRIIFAVPLGIMFVGMLLGASRGGIIGLGVMTVYLAWRTRKFKELAYVLTIGLVASLAFPSVWSRFTDPTQGEGSGRVPIWVVGIYAFKQHWLGGVGVGNFELAYDQSFLHAYQDQFQGWSRPSHNTLLGMATELGVIGLILLVLAAIAQFRSVDFIDRASPLFPIRIAVEAGMLALVAESMFIDILWYKYLWLGFALMAALRATALSHPQLLSAKPEAAARPLTTSLALGESSA